MTNIFDIFDIIFNFFRNTIIPFPMPGGGSIDISLWHIIVGVLLANIVITFVHRLLEE